MVRGVLRSLNFFHESALKKYQNFPRRFKGRKVDKRNVFSKKSKTHHTFFFEFNQLVIQVITLS